MSPRKIIIDTDPGQDDAVAILLALASPEEIEVLGITAVAGNVPLGLTARNARIVCELAGRSDVPVFSGCAEPLSRPLVTAEHVHGKTGLDGPVLPDPTMELQPEHAVQFIIDTLRKEPAGSVTLCPLGPLTNIATAFRDAPDIVDRGRHRAAQAAISVRTANRASSCVGSNTCGAAGASLSSSRKSASAATANSATSLTTASTAIVSTSPALSPAWSARRDPNRMANSAISPVTISTSSSAATCVAISGSRVRKEELSERNCNAM